MSKHSKELASPPGTSTLFLSSILSWKRFFWAMAGFSAVAMVYLSLGYGIIWDEWIQSHYGKLVLKFLLTGGQDKSALTFGETMYLYGGLFDTITAAVYGLLFDSLKNVANYPLQSDLVLKHWHDVRHVINALFGFSAILFTGLAAKRIAGWRAGTIAFIFLLLSPRFFGNSMNNPKDIPFAAAAAIFSYFMIRLFQEIPKPSWKTLFGIAAGIAIAINIKAGGLLFLFYAWLFIGLTWISFSRPFSGNFPFLSLLKILIPVSLIGYFAGVIFWPYGLMNPLTHPIQALGAFSQFSGAAGHLLFEGQIYEHGKTPWYYLLKWVLISNPLFFIFSLFLFIFSFRFLFSKYRSLILAFLLFCAFFPLAYAIFKKSVVYDSWRHFLFVYPPLIILAALAWESLWDRADTRFKKVLVSSALILLLFEPFSWMFRNHPNEYVYFNPLVGGIRGAHGNYETDYWGNCLRQASEGFIAEYKTTHPPGPIVIKAQGEPISTIPFLARGLGNFYVPFSPNKNKWQYSIEMARGREPEILKNGTWPGSNAVYIVTADQTPLCAVIENK